LSNKIIKPELFLFLSIDVVGSTAFKNKRGEDSDNKIQPWLSFFMQFYEDFKIIFLESCQEAQNKKTDLLWIEDKKKSANRPNIELFKLWKSLGDELIFYVPLTHHKQALFYVHAFRDATNGFKSKMHTKGLTELDYKLTGWLAGFPVINARINYELPDFIGPSIDIGFRLSKFSDQRKFVVSVDLALMLVKHTNHLKLFYDGEHTIKGFLSDKPYPIIWVDMNDIESNEERKLGKSHADPKQLQDFCIKYIKDTGKPLIIPFIDKDQEFGVKPSGYDEDFKTVCELIENLSTNKKMPSKKTQGVKPKGMEMTNKNKLLNELKPNQDTK